MKALPKKFDDKWAAQKLTIEISWERIGGRTSMDLNKLYSRSLQESPEVGRPVVKDEPLGALFYHGSTFCASGFAAQIEGSIFSLIQDPAALSNLDRGEIFNPTKVPGLGNAVVFSPNPAQVPSLGTAVVFSLSLAPKP